MKKMNKKGAYGIEIVTTVALGLFILLLVAVAIIAGATAISNSNLIQLSSGSALEVNRWLNATTYTLGQSTLVGFSPTITSIINATSGEVIPASNYTLTGNVLTNATAKAYPTVNISYTYTYYSNGQNAINGIVRNNSAALSGFFGNSSTFFSILAVVVIMIFLGLMIGAVYLFTRDKDKGI